MVRIVSKQPRKQRKARFNAPNHTRGRFLSRRSRPTAGSTQARVVKNDTVRNLRGTMPVKGVVDSGDMKTCRLIVHGVMATKADRTESDDSPSNVQITKPT